MATLIGMLAAAPAVRAGALGSSGGLSVPDPETLCREQYQLAVYGEFFNETNLNTGGPASTADLNFVGNFGVYDNLELGIRRMARVNSPIQGESLQITGKYRIPIDTYNITIGMNMATSNPDWSALYLVAGWKALWLGFGYNFGGQRLREVTRSRISSVGTSTFGGYNVRTARNSLNEPVVTGQPDTVFGLMGVNFKLSEQLRALADFDGDRFSGGFRFNFKDFNVDAAYVSQKEKYTLLDRRTDNLQVGLGVTF